MPGRGVPPVSARVVASFTHVLSLADTGDTAHSQLLSLTLADSAHPVSGVDDEAQLHLSCHGAGGLVTKERITTSGLRGYGGVAAASPCRAGHLGRNRRTILEGARGPGKARISGKHAIKEPLRTQLIIGARGQPGAWVRLDAGWQAAPEGPARGRTAFGAGYRRRVVAASSLVHEVAASLLVSAVSRKEPFMARARTGTRCPR
jgi:hypothetical protein